jgi:hypothetical protein
MARMTPEPPDAVEPDTKDWTWVLDKPCPDCDFDCAAVDRAELPARVVANADAFAHALERPDARSRPRPGTWSVVEYACHVRDVHRVFDGRVQAMLGEDDPQFENWDQDATALEDHYGEQDPAVVARELVAAAAAVAATYAAVADDQWQRPGRRSNGSVFTIDSLARYHLHDVEHHRWDVEA